MEIIAIITIEFILSYSLTYLFRKIAIRKSILDIPNERSSHKIPTPRGGGLAIILVWFGGLTYLYIQKQIDSNLFFSLLSGLILAFVSLIDDIISLKPYIRILAQAISVLGALYFLHGFQLIPNLNNPLFFWLINIVIVLGFIWFINLYNFLDGIDAYASQEAILVSLGMALITNNLIFGLLIASVSGFLIWNKPKAKIFMGDVGSTQLGFILVVLGIYFHNTLEFNIINWLILTSLFWFDASITLFFRWRNKEKLSIAHKKHMYQRLNQSGFSHYRVNIFAILFNALLIGVVWLNINYFKQGILILGLVCILLFYIFYWINKRLAFKK